MNWHLPPMGQVSGVTQGADGTLWVLHRANRVWDANSFAPSKPELTTYTEGIAEDTVYRIDQDTGTLLAARPDCLHCCPTPGHLRAHHLPLPLWGFRCCVTHSATARWCTAGYVPLLLRPGGKHEHHITTLSHPLLSLAIVRQANSWATGALGSCSCRT